MLHLAKALIALLGIVAPATLLPFAYANAAEPSAFINEVARDWDRAAFNVKDESKQLAALKLIQTRLSEELKTDPQNAPIRAWRGIILATEANGMSGLAALKKADAARKELEKAIAIDPNPTGDGYAFAILGALYDAAPGFPIGFGDKKKALKNIKTALALNPDSIDAGYFLGVFYANRGDVAAAKEVLASAKRAPPRPGREIGDAGRLKDIQDLFSDLAAKQR